MIKTAKRSLIVSVAVMTLLLTLAASPALAIRHGDLDGDDHPYVGLMVAQLADGTPLWRCSGTLMSPTIFLTAGHCTEAPAERAQIWFDADVTDAAAHNYPFVGDVGGTTHTHPDYDPNAFYVRDLGVVVLDTPVVMDEYGALPEQDQLDSMKPGKRSIFTAVGYGLQRSFPDAASWKNVSFRIRMVATPQLKQINSPNTGDYSIWLTNNASSGGTCFGDSGGPNFIGDSNVVGGVTSYGINTTCAGTGGVFRVDREWSLDWLETFGL